MVKSHVARIRAVVEDLQGREEEDISSASQYNAESLAITVKTLDSAPHIRIRKMFFSLDDVELELELQIPGHERYAELCGERVHIRELLEFVAVRPHTWPDKCHCGAYSEYRVAVTRFNVKRQVCFCKACGPVVLDAMYGFGLPSMEE